MLGGAAIVGAESAQAPTGCSSLREDNLDDCEKCWERGDRKGGAKDRGPTPLCSPLKPDTKRDQCWREEPTARTEPRREDVAQRIGKKAASRKDQANREYNTSHGKEQEDQRARSSTTHDA